MTTKPLCLIAVLLIALSALAQEPQKAATRIDSFKKPNCDDLQSRLDYLASEATSTPGSVGFVVLYPGGNIFANVSYERIIAMNSAFRNFPPGLVRVIRGPRREEAEFELWIGSNESIPPVVDVPFEYRLPNIVTRTRFVEDSAEIVKIDGKLEYIPDGCDGQFSLEVLSKVLSANPELSAEIVIFNRKSSGARRLSKFLLDEATSENAIPRGRLRVIYGGIGIAKEWGNGASAIELWILPTTLK